MCFLGRLVAAPLSNPHREWQEAAQARCSAEPRGRKDTTRFVNAWPVVGEAASIWLATSVRTVSAMVYRLFIIPT